VKFASHPEAGYSRRQMLKRKREARNERLP
jgi:hypothetical protein